MYHARIDEQNKQQILNSFSKSNGCVRILVATIAYGMGIRAVARTLIGGGGVYSYIQVLPD